MELTNLQIMKKDVMVNTDSDVMVMFNSNLSFQEAKLVNQVRKWEKF